MAASLIGAGISGVVGLVGRFFDSKDKREQNVQDQQTGTTNELSSEFSGPRENRTKWDSFVDGLNRLPRPALVAWVMWLLTMSYWAPYEFTEMMIALSMVPEWLALVFAQIIMLFFGGRMMENFKGFNAVPIAQVKSTIALMNQVHEEKVKVATAAADANARINPPSAPTLVGVAPILKDAEFKKEMADATKPLSNAAILEWNRRRQNSGTQ